jgi:UDP:flavonoid glycosyltransferase YjiC (YdhE family)
MAHFILVPVGSHGDVHPFVGIGAALVGRGHRVTMITAESFRGVATRNGMEFVGTLSTDEYTTVMHHPDLWHPKKGLKVILDHGLMRKYLPVTFDAIRERYEPGKTVAVGGSLGFAARVAHEVLGIPYATAHLQPMSCCSVKDPPVSSSGVNMTWLPGPLVRLGYWAAEKWIIDPLMAPPINEFRRTLGLPPARRILTKWSPSPQRVIGMFPDWFGSVPDAGPAFRHSGFVMFGRRSSSASARRCGTGGRTSRRRRRRAAPSACAACCSARAASRSPRNCRRAFFTPTTRRSRRSFRRRRASSTTAVSAPRRRGFRRACRSW